MTKKIICLYMPDGGEAGVIQAWLAGEHKWVEFRGAPYSQWRVGEVSPMSALHDALEGMHATVLHQDSILAVHEGHADFGWVMELFRKAERFSPFVVREFSPDQQDG